MKILPCGNCKLPALASKKPELFHAAGALHDPVVVILCKRCGRNVRITSDQFARLPEMTAEELMASTSDFRPTNDPR